MTRSQSCDVAVVGAGAAGFGAAVAASGAGLSTVLIEGGPAPGGNVRAALVHTICGLYHASLEGEPTYANAGLPQAFAESLRVRGGAGNPARSRSAVYVPIDPEMFSRHAAARLQDCKGLNLRFNHRVTQADLATTPEGTSRLEILSEDEVHELQAKVVIDTSGDAAVAAAGGARFEEAPPDGLQHASLIFRMDNVATPDLDRMETGRISVAVARAAKSGDLPASVESAVVRHGVHEGQIYVTLNLPKALPGLEGRTFAPLDPTFRALFDKAALETAGQLGDFLVRSRPAFASAHIGALPETIGVRETRRIHGLRRLETEAVSRGRRSDEEVCVSTWPIELWSEHRRVHFEPTDGPCSVPLGALVSSSHPGLGMAGRCMSASHEALGATRVLGTAMATGEAIGTAAGLALSAGTDLAAVDPALVRERIAATTIPGKKP